MKLFITAAAATLISTAAFAENSDRYNDLMLDTSETAERVYSDGVEKNNLERAQRGADQQYTTADENKTPDVTFSTRSDITSVGESYPYGGYGPGNDSR
ncbi:hypothetical protein Z946_2608 [Sulfitobacter noctilucicola]|uniref:Uncharacterized protein n=1 Tax=Sulfitobacter noctilucicola TaxID=1342301 RepID=A0A7W6Q411_9RHOB|nr:hypothetical protein [Sulfitobacter noctilucicola]KIN63735.1 hypothetical protein Z946_2608 [Sulfitobacter noctilucicola]MBB4174755.1 hypothetical protein [Sulfitobacter noctilucicola]